MKLDLIGEVFDKAELADAIRNAEEDIELTINSEGGSVFDGLQIVNAIQQCPHKVTAKVEVMACSIAFVIAMVADRCEVSKNDIGMAHCCWTVAIGNKKDLEQEIEAMKTIDTILQNIIMENCTDETFKQRMDEGDVWMTGEEMAELFNNVELVEREKKLGKVASGCLVNLLAEFNILREKMNLLDKAEEKAEKDEENEEKPEENEEEETEEEEKDYILDEDIKNLLLMVDNLE